MYFFYISNDISFYTFFHFRRYVMKIKSIRQNIQMVLFYFNDSWPISYHMGLNIICTGGLVIDGIGYLLTDE